MLPRLKAWLGLQEIVAAASFWKRDSVRKFEKVFAGISQQSYAVAFPYGRTGLYCLLKALKLEGKEIICPAYTCVVVPHAVVTAGATPVFVDSCETDFNMDWDLVEKAITEKTGAVIATSIFGQPVDVDTVQRFKAKYPEILIIQDCAHSFFAGKEGEKVNVAGDAAFYGLNISKIMTSIFGGMVTTDNPEIRDSLREVRSIEISGPSVKKSFTRLIYLVCVWIAFNRTVYGFVNRLERSGLLDRFVKYFDDKKIDMPNDYKVGMTGVEARVGIVQCEKYPEIIRHRQELASIYKECLSGLNGLELPNPAEGHTFSHYVIETKQAQDIVGLLLKENFQLGELIDYFIPEMECYRNEKFWGGGVARKWPGNVINLPVHKGCNKKDSLEICDYLVRCNLMSQCSADENKRP